MIAVMGFLIANKGLYTHSHKVESGSVYVHSHPFDKAKDSQPYKSHHHTKAQIFLFENLNILFFSVFLLGISLFVIKIKHFFFDRVKIYYQLFSYSNFGRAPPVL